MEEGERFTPRIQTNVKKEKRNVREEDKEPFERWSSGVGAAELVQGTRSGAAHFTVGGSGRCLLAAGGTPGDATTAHRLCLQRSEGASRGEEASRGPPAGRNHECLSARIAPALTILA